MNKESKYRRAVKIIVIKSYLEIFVSISVIAGIIFGIMSFFNFSNNDKIEQTLQRITQFQTGNLSEDRDRLFRFWIEPSSLLAVRLPLADRQRYVADRIALDLDDGHILSVVALVSFFDEMYYCIESGVCNRAIAQEQLGGYASALISNYYIIIQQLNCNGFVSNSLVGIGLLRFSDSEESFNCNRLDQDN